MSETDPGETGNESREWRDPPGVGDEPDHEPIEPGSPSAENVAFVVVGVLGALYVIARIAGLV